MKERFYVMFVQHNKEVNAENRTVPKGFDKLNEAYQAFYEQLGKDMKNATLDWSVGFILTNNGATYESRFWKEEIEEPVETPTE